MKTYVMKCGCRLALEELVRSKRSGDRCPHHTDHGTDYVEIECIDCGEIVIVKPRAQGTSRCEICQHARKKAKWKKAKAERSDPNFEAKQKQLEDAAAAAWDCVNRASCLDAVVRDPSAKYLPCYGCERYKRAGVDAA